jgi:hypothetical protein
MAKSDTPVRRKASLLWLEGLVCGAILAFAPATAVLVGVLLAPAVASFAVDTEPGHGTTRAVTLACMAGALSPVWHLWLAHDSMEMAVMLLCDPLSLTLAWGGGACAWSLCQILPVFLQAIWQVRETIRAKAIQAELKRLKEDWFLD